MSYPGYARIIVRDPRPLRPPALPRDGIGTQANAGDLTFKCYGADVTAVGTGISGSKFCGGP